MTKIRTVFWMFLVVMVFLVLSCGNSPQGPQTTATPTASSVTPTITPTPTVSGAVTPSPTAEPVVQGKIPRDFWGRWTRLDTAELWYVGDTYTEIAGVRNALSQTSMTGTMFTLADSTTVTKQSTNVLEISRNGSTFYVFRQSGSNSSFSTQLIATLPETGSAGVSRKMTALTGIKTLIKNKKNELDVQEAVSDASGKIIPTKPTIVGDTYTVEIVGPIPPAVTTATGISDVNIPTPVVVNPIFETQDVGTLPVSTTTKNLKVTVIDAKSYFNNVGDDGFRYPNKDYTISIRVTNVGTTDFISPRYTLTSSAGLFIVRGATTGLLSTIEPGLYADLNLTVQASSLINESEFRSINVLLEDTVNSQTWNDSVQMQFWNRTIEFLVAADGVINGMIVSPENKSYKLSGRTSYTVTLPWREKDYLVVFSGASAQTEVNYKLGVNMTTTLGAPYTLPDNNAALYEPNNTETAATLINNQIVARLTKGDIDYYRVRGTTNISVIAPYEFIVKVNPPSAGTTIFATDMAQTFTATLSHAADSYIWYGDGQVLRTGNLYNSNSVPPLVLEPNAFSWGSHEITLVILKDQSKFSGSFRFQSQ